jgi:hypothetical protein
MLWSIRVQRTSDWVCHHLHPNGLQKAVKQAVRSTNLQKRVSCHTFYFLSRADDIRLSNFLLNTYSEMIFN